jgi:hypothetical protein
MNDQNRRKDTTVEASSRRLVDDKLVPCAVILLIFVFEKEMTEE